MAGHRPRANPHPIDQEVFVPEAVRRASQAADAAMQAAAPQPPPQPAPQPTPINPQEFIQIEEPPAPARLPTMVTTPDATPAPAPEPPPQPQVPDDDESWKNKYESILGRFRHATADLANSNRRIEALENMLAGSTAAQPAPAPAPTPTPVSLVTEQELADLGPEMADIIRRLARQESSQLVPPNIMSELESLRRQVNGVSTTQVVDARERMHLELDQALPTWQQINHAQQFHDWLALSDPFSGVTRMKLLRDAYAQNKSPQVLAIFKAFVSEQAALQPTMQPTVPTPEPQPARPTLQELASPGRARTAASVSTPAEKQIIRTSDINKFYADKRRNVYAGREEEFAAAERELQQAMREGRVVRDT
jgi:hypothetical protein